MTAELVTRVPDAEALQFAALAAHAEYAAHLEMCDSCRQDDDCADLAILESACDAAVARAYGG